MMKYRVTSNSSTQSYKQKQQQQQLSKMNKFNEKKISMKKQLFQQQQQQKMTSTLPMKKLNLYNRDSASSSMSTYSSSSSPPFLESPNSSICSNSYNYFLYNNSYLLPKIVSLNHVLLSDSHSGALNYEQNQIFKFLILFTSFSF